MYFKKSLLVLLAAAIMLGLSYAPAKSQALPLLEMTYKSFQGSYEPLGSYSYYWSGSSYYQYPQIDLPFVFYFDGQPNKYVFFADAGYLGLAPYTNYSQYYYSRAHDKRNQITAFQWYYTGPYPGTKKYGVIGSSPNRVAVFDWDGVYVYFGNYGKPFRFQIRLYETSNIAEIVYGSDIDVSGWFIVTDEYYKQYYYYRGLNCFGGNGYDDNNMANNRFINIIPKADYQHRGCFSNNKEDVQALRDHNGTYSNDTPTWGTLYKNEHANLYKPNLTLQITAYPSVTALNPRSGAILERGNVYDGKTPHKPGFLTENYQGGDGVFMTYQISGPLPKSSPDYQILYRATVEGTNTNYSVPITANGWSYFTESNASLPGAKISPNNTGDLDLQSRQDEIPGGEYIIEGELQMPEASYYQSIDSKFIIALTNDLAITLIESPKSNQDRKYPLSSGQIPIKLKITNIGLNDVDHFIAYMKMTDSKGNSVNEEQVEWYNNASPLKMGQFAQIEFTNFRPREVGDFCLQFYVDLIGADDDAEINNYAPRQGSTYCFNVAHEVDAEPLEIIDPAGTIYVGRPIRPMVKVGNNGVSDMSDVPATMEIKDEKDNVIYSSNVIIQDIPSGKYNTVYVRMPDDFVPPKMGEYTVCFTTNSPDDPVKENNTVCSSFSVTSAMQGVYTIGRRFEDADRNYVTIQDAINDLYLEGMTGPVYFEFTDSYYEAGISFNNEDPSVDMRSNIVGLNEKNTITFRPATNRSTMRGGVEIHLVGGSGLGFMFGQTVIPSNAYAPIHVVRESKKKEFANSPGYIIFDGGSIKSLKFVTDNVNAKFRTAFYLAQGTSNVTIKNVLIEDANPSGLCDLPNYMFNAGTSSFEYEADNRSTPSLVKAYTTGILLRSKVPQDQNKANPYNLDTLFNTKNRIENNEISGFGYGIVSLGGGVLFRQGHAKYNRYYNFNNTYQNNIIHDVTRAGIFLGYEQNSTIAKNLIYNVTGTCGTDAAGIIAGGDKEGGWLGYNNIGLVIDGNEISRIYSNSMSYGIKVEQAQISFQNPIGGVVTYPEIAENMIVRNNVVWNVNTTNPQGSRAGIRLFTQLAMNTGDPLLNQLRPSVTDYLTRGDKIVNNTVLMNDDGLTTAGMIVGIGVQASANAVVKNNAVALLDVDAGEISPAYACMFYEGKLPKEGGLMSDYNAFYYPSKVGAAVYRFVEVDDNFNILDGAATTSNVMYASLNQWQSWTNSDMNSVFGDFTDDFIYTGVEPNQKLRINLAPQPPLGSILNNRGQRLVDVEYDIDNNVRGPAGQRYDIGAFEFNGRMFITDVEVMNIPKPGAYLANTFYDDAEYIMTKSPIEVMARIRNNGNLDLTGHKSYIYIFRERADGTFPSGEANAEVADTVMFNIPQTETIEVLYNMADGKLKEFNPKTFGDLQGSVPAYIIPRRFTHMENNVTPRYRIEIHVEADQDNANNMMSKIVRFYIPRSDLSILITNEQGDAELEFPLPSDPQPTQNQISGRLNFDTLAASFKDLGWTTKWNSAEGKVDVLNRNAWEEKSVDYTLYRTVIYSDAEDKPLTRWGRVDLERFLDNGKYYDKANLIIGSQEMVRQNKDLYPIFLSEYLRANYIAPGNPLGRAGVANDWNVNNNMNTVSGVTIGKDLGHLIRSTNFTKYIGDKPPYCGLMSIEPQGEGLANIAYVYNNFTPGNTQIMGIAQTTLTRNVILYGVDWRHWENAEMVLRASIDFLEKSGGVVVPIELLSFDAKENGNRVNVFWSTASELNSDRFEVEKSVMTDAGKGLFTKINDTKAQGKSNVKVNYGPVVDRNVSNGKTYFYRLKMIDLDGQYKYSNEVEVKMGSGSLWMSEPNPNPAQVNAEISYTVPQDGNVEIAVYSLDGKKLTTVFNGNKAAGSYNANFDLSSFSSGAYNIVITSNGSMLTRQLRIVR